MGNHNDSKGFGGASHGSSKEYVTGLMLSIVLTVIPFGMVMLGLATPLVAIIVIVACAIAQLLVQAVFFLHMNTSSEQSWNLVTATYCLFVLVALVIGSIWIFFHLHHNTLMGH